jgi:hypothetical protein
MPAGVRPEQGSKDRHEETSRLVNDGDSKHRPVKPLTRSRFLDSHREGFLHEQTSQWNFLLHQPVLDLIAVERLNGLLV